MADAELTGQLAGGLPSYFPSSPKDDNYRLMEAVAARFENDADSILEIDTLTTVQEITEENIELHADNLTVEAGDSYSISTDETESFYRVEVEGTLNIYGTLQTTDLSGSGEVNIQGDGKIVGMSAAEYGGIASLYELGKLVQVSPQDGESLGRYRARVIAGYALATGKGTIEDLLDAAALMLDINVEGILYEENPGGETGAVSLSVPDSAVSDLELTISELTEILDRLIAAGYSIDAEVTGTFTYISVDDYESGNHDASRGYSGLNANDEPDGSGGTYAGVIR